MEPIRVERTFTADEVLELTGWDLAELIWRVNRVAEGLEPDDVVPEKPRRKRSVVAQAICNSDKEDVPVPRRRGRPRKIQQPVPMLQRHPHDDTPDADHAQEEMSSSF